MFNILSFLLITRLQADTNAKLSVFTGCLLCILLVIQLIFVFLVFSDLFSLKPSYSTKMESGPVISGVSFQETDDGFRANHIYSK